MSSRGWLVTNPDKKSSKLLSESRQHVPLLWFGFLQVEDCDQNPDSVFCLDRRAAIVRAEESIDFLQETIPDIPNFAEVSREFLDRLRKLRCKTIGIGLSDLASTEEMPEPNLRTAVSAVSSRNAAFALTRQARTVNGVRLEALDLKTTRDLLLKTAWLSPNHIAFVDDEGRASYVVGYVWEKHLPKASPN